MLDLKTGTSGLVPGMYYVRVSSADTNLFGSGSEYELRIYVPMGQEGVIKISVGSGSDVNADVQVTIHPPEAYTAGARWCVLGYPVWSEGQTYVHSIDCGVSVMLEYKDISDRGWKRPAYREVAVACGDAPPPFLATYTPIPPGQLAVSPADGLAATGYVGGPFSPPSATYTLSNSGGQALNWSASSTVPWLTVSAGSGPLAAGNSTTVTISINTNANILGPSNYSGTISFTNTANGQSNTARAVSLRVMVHPPVILSNPRVVTNGGVAMTLQGVTNGVYSIVVSSNLMDSLTNWMEALRLTNSGGLTAFTNQPSSNAVHRYYRAKEL